MPRPTPSLRAIATRAQRGLRALAIAKAPAVGRWALGIAKAPPAGHRALAAAGALLAALHLGACQAGSLAAFGGLASGGAAGGGGAQALAQGRLAGAGNGLLGPWGWPQAWPTRRQAEAPSPEAIAQLKASAKALRGWEVGGDESDLAPIAQSLQGVTLLGLGEATHGTSEFFKLKQRLVAHASQRLGFTGVAIEGGSALAEALNRHVAGQGGLAEALAREPLGWWNTEELWAFANWARQEAQRGGPTLRFASADFQSPQADMAALLAKLPEPLKAEAKQAFAGIAWEALLWESFGNLPQAQREARVAAVKRVHDQLPGRSSALLKHQAWLVWQAAELRLMVSNPATAMQGFARRDALMAEQLLWLQGQAGFAKLIYWAHNSHVGRFSTYAGIPGFDSTGLKLSQSLKGRYQALGSSFDRGAVSAMPAFGGSYQSIAVGEALPNSVDALLKQAGPLHWLPVGQVPAASPLGAWLGQERPMRNVGYVVDPKSPPEALHHPVRASQAFDALIHLAESRPAHPRP